MLSPLEYLSMFPVGEDIEIADHPAIVIRRASVEQYSAGSVYYRTYSLTPSATNPHFSIFRKESGVKIAVGALFFEDCTLSDWELFNAYLKKVSISKLSDGYKPGIQYGSGVNMGDFSYLGGRKWLTRLLRL